MYVRVMFSSEGASPMELIRTMAELGFTPAMGEYDFFYKVDETPQHYRETLKRLHDNLRGLRVMYTITTKKA